MNNIAILILVLIVQAEAVEIFGNIENVLWDDKRGFALKIGTESVVIKRNADNTFRVKIPKLGVYEVFASYEVADPVKTTANEYHALYKWAKFCDLTIAQKDKNVINNMAHALYCSIDGPPIPMDGKFVYDFNDTVKPTKFSMGSRIGKENTIICDTFGISDIKLVKVLVITEISTKKQWFIDSDPPKPGKTVIKFASFTAL